MDQYELPVEGTVEPVQPEVADDAQNVAAEMEEPVQQEASPLMNLTKEQYERRVKSISASAKNTGHQQGYAEAMQQFMGGPEYVLAQRLAEIYPDKTIDQIVDDISAGRAETLAAQLEENPKEVLKELLKPRTPPPQQIPARQVTPQMMFERAAQEAQAAFVPPEEWNALVNRQDFQEAVMRGDSFHAAQAIAQLNEMKQKQTGNPSPPQTMKNAQRVNVANNPVDKMTRDQMEDFIRRAERGERIAF